MHYLVHMRHCWIYDVLVAELYRVCEPLALYWFDNGMCEGGNALGTWTDTNYLLSGTTTCCISLSSLKLALEYFIIQDVFLEDYS